MNQLTANPRWITIEMMSYAGGLARRFQHLGVELDDLKQEAYLGLCIASAKYDEKQEASFKTFSTWYIFKQLKQAVRQGRLVTLPEGGDDDYTVHLLNGESLDSLLAEVEVAQLSMEEDEPDDQTVLRQYAQVCDLTQVLTKQELQVLFHLYGIDRPKLTVKECAVQMKLGTQRVIHLHNRALNRINTTF